MNNYSLSDFKVKNYSDIGDHLFLISDGMPYKIPIGNISAGGDWNDILNKPFDDYDSEVFSLNAVTVNNEISRQLTIKPEFINGKIDDKITDFKDSELSDIIDIKITDFRDNELEEIISLKISDFKTNVLPGEIDGKIDEFKTDELVTIITNQMNYRYNTTTGVALGAGTSATSHNLAAGLGSKAAAAFTFACGQGCNASGLGSVALGQESSANGQCSFAVGNDCNANGTHSHAEGSESTAEGNNSLAFGARVKSIGDYSMAFGGGSVSTGNYSFTFGGGCKAEKDNSFAFGSGSTAEGSNSFAFGGSAKSIGNYSLAFGGGSISEGVYSIAVGAGGKASGKYSFVGGGGSNAEGDFSFSYGCNVLTTTPHEVAFGCCNKSDEKTLFSIGNGTTDERKNIFEIDSDGNVYAKKFIGETDVSGLDFNALSAALTGGIQNGISITTDNENNLFNFTVNGMPEIGIDSEGYWTVNGLRGENSTIAKGEKGDSGENGFTPTITVSESDDGINITITNSDGNTSVALSNGITPHIDSTNYHWFIGDEDTGVCAKGEVTRDEFDELKTVIGELNTALENVLNGGE